MKTLGWNCPACDMLIHVKYNLGDGGITKVEVGNKCPVCLREITESEILEYIFEKDEELNQ